MIMMMVILSIGESIEALVDLRIGRVIVMIINSI